jgi:hypothetical protein
MNTHWAMKFESYIKGKKDGLSKVRVLRLAYARTSTYRFVNDSHLQVQCSHTIRVLCNKTGWFPACCSTSNKFNIFFFQIWI